jgi:hypothetical protein
VYAARPAASVVNGLPSKVNWMPASAGTVCTVTVIGHGLRCGCGRLGFGAAEAGASTARTAMMATSRTAHGLMMRFTVR